MREKVADPTPEELADFLFNRLFGDVRTFRQAPDRYEHTVSAADPALEDWPQEINVDDEETKNYK